MKVRIRSCDDARGPVIAEIPWDADEAFLGRLNRMGVVDPTGGIHQDCVGQYVVEAREAFFEIILPGEGA